MINQQNYLNAIEKIRSESVKNFAMKMHIHQGCAYTMIELADMFNIEPDKAKTNYQHLKDYYNFIFEVTKNGKYKKYRLVDVGIMSKSKSKEYQATAKAKQKRKLISCSFSQADRLLNKVFC